MLKNRRLAMLAVAAAMLAGPAFGREAPVVVYMRGSTEDAVESIAAMCVQRNIPVIDQGARHVVCGAEVEGFSGILTQVLIGNSYSTTPKGMSRFTVIGGRDYVTIQATQWLETQMAFGQVRQVPVTGKKNAERLRLALISAGAYTSPPPPIVPVAKEDPAPVQSPTPEAKPTPPQQPARAKRPAVICVTCRN